MSLNHSPSITMDSLLLNLDFANSKRFTSSFGTNLVQNPTYNVSTWGTYSTMNSSGIDAPDGSTTAMRMTSIKRDVTYTLTTNIVTVAMPNHGFATSQNHYFQFTSGTGVSGYYTITVVNANTFTIPITAANGSGNVTVHGRTGLRVGITPFTPNGTDTYTFSFWVRLIRGTFTLSTTAWCDLRDAVPSLNYTSQLVQDQWVYITSSAVATATSKDFFDLLSDCFGDIVLDFWGLKVENQTANNTPLPFKDTVGGYTFNIYRPVYSTFDTNSITFNRNSIAPKWGGVATTTGTGALTSTNFLYNNHTWEVWFKINDITPSGLPTNEAWSCLALYTGYHAGFMYTSTSMQYMIWNNTSGLTAASWTIGTTGAQINQGSWYQIMVTREGNVFTPYLNGVALGTGSTTPTAVLTGVSNVICIGGTQIVAAGASDYVYYAKNSISNMKMYNRALSATEVSQNFNALRGRFGI